MSEFLNEDVLEDIPFHLDVSNYLAPEDDTSGANGNGEPTCFDGMTDAEVERRLKGNQVSPGLCGFLSCAPPGKSGSSSSPAEFSVNFCVAHHQGNPPFRDMSLSEELQELGCLLTKLIVKQHQQKNKINKLKKEINEIEISLNETIGSINRGEVRLTWDKWQLLMMEELDKVRELKEEFEDRGWQEHENLAELLMNKYQDLVHPPPKMASHIVGYPRMGPKGELISTLWLFWKGKKSAKDLKETAAKIRSSIWKQMEDAGIKYIPSNTFSYYDHVLDTTAMLGAVPPRYEWNGGAIGFDVYFSMARGNPSVPAMAIANWFDTIYHYTVPELGPEVNFSYASHKAVEEYKEAKALGVNTVPVLVGPVSYLLLSKPAKGVEKSFSLLSLLPKILPIYKEVVSELKAAGASWIQFDEPLFVMDLESHQLEAFTAAYSELESTLSGLNVVVETYFADLTSEAYKTLTSLKGVTGFGFDLICGKKTIELIKAGFPSGKYLFAGVIDGRNIWANDLVASIATLESLECVVGKDKLVVSTSCSLLHTPVDLVNETELDDEIKSWLAFAAQKVVEVNALAKALAGHKDEVFFSANATAQALRRSSPRVNNADVQKAAAALRGSDHRRVKSASSRLDAQKKKLKLPVFPTTTIGVFPQTIELNGVDRRYKAKKTISEDEYVSFIKEEISKVVKLQEELDIDVLVDGSPERNNSVNYFFEQMSGIAFTVNGWVQCSGTYIVKPPVIYGDVSRLKAMTVLWSSLAQSMTARPMKGTLISPVSLLNRSFVRNDQPSFETCYQIALAIKDEVEDLEKAGINVIEILEYALCKAYFPLRRSEHAFYFEWVVRSFRITNCGVQDTTQIHTHLCCCCSQFNDIIHSIIEMDADVITLDPCSDEKLLLPFFREGAHYWAGIGPGVYDGFSPSIPSTEEITARIRKMIDVIDTNILWVNPNCTIRTPEYTVLKLALLNMVAAAKLLRQELEMKQHKNPIFRHGNASGKIVFGSFA